MDFKRTPMSCSRVVYTFLICAETHWLCGSQRRAVTPMAPHGRLAESANPFDGHIRQAVLLLESRPH